MNDTASESRRLKTHHSNYGAIEDYSGWGNEVLYRMCAERPGHSCIDAVTSKLWLIGRSYTAAIERGAGKNFQTEKVVEILIGSELDARTRKLQAIERIDTANASTLLSAHHYLTELFKKATRLRKRPLASKHLHFHAPTAVFIYDSISASQVGEFVPAKVLPTHPIRGYDDPYSDFVARCLACRSSLEGLLCLQLSPQRIDMELQDYWKKRIACIRKYRKRKGINNTQSNPYSLPDTQLQLTKDPE